MRGIRDRLSDGFTEVEQRPRRGKLGAILMVVCFVAAVVLGGHLVINTARSHNKPVEGSREATPAPPPSQSVTPSSPASPSSALPEGTDHQGAAGRPSSTVTTAAARFVDAWLLQKPPAARLAALRPVATEYLASSLARSDLNALPLTVRYGEPKLMTWTALAAQYRVWLRTGETVDLTLMPDGGPIWKVTVLEPGPKGAAPKLTSTR